MATRRLAEAVHDQQRRRDRDPPSPWGGDDVVQVAGFLMGGDTVGVPTDRVAAPPPRTRWRQCFALLVNFL
jgi:hypothetical protein